ncbi:MAG: hypothetical protein Gaeavirus1_18 [Gaeavirus sp.]|uniref:F-box and FNIP repeat-containing protein n=1 Tax=Gaeavirus sp. TaxID=2487767 RepID=A0A3G5A117_9VIRU|nr:MAG: hypothetical protein Gaeavirus1_18 [Gaeavirus sp.]
MNEIDRCLEQFYFRGRTRLVFDNSFDRLLDDAHFPDSLVRIKFGYSYDRSLDGVSFPDNVCAIYFGTRFNQSLDKVIFPKNLSKIRFGSEFNKPIDNLPCSIEKLVFYTVNMNVTNLPFSVKLIKIIYVDDMTMEGLIRIPYGCRIVDSRNRVVK